MNLMQRRRALLEGGKKRLLPDEYQQVEWVANTGVRYITAGQVDLALPLRMRVGVYKTADGTSLSTVCGLGYGSNGSNKDGIDLKNGVRARINSTQYAISGAPSSTNVYIEAELSLENDKSIITARYSDDTIYSKTINTVATLSDVREKDVVLWQSQNNVKMTGRIYYCEVYQYGNKVMHLVPCYRKSDNEIGMYDVVQKKFRTGAGSGSFTKGADVT